MREPESRDIEGVTYVVTPIPSSKGIALTLRLGRILGPTLAEVTKLAGQSDEDVKGRGLAIIGRAAEGLLERATETELRLVWEPLAENTRVDLGGKRPTLLSVFEVHFAGRLDLFARWLAFALEVNLGPLGAMLGNVKPLPVGGDARA